MAVRWPAGIRSAGVSCGIKPGGELDLGIVSAERPVRWAGTFTQSGAAAAPVLWSRSLLGRPVQAVVVNSGNANACTGAAGAEAVARTADAAAAALGCSPEEVAVASTGPIGVTLPLTNVLGGLPIAARHLGDDTAAFADAILTTDTHPKVTRHAGAGFEVVGVAKGAAMLAPNMATMLAFVATDADVDGVTLQSALTRAVRDTFDRVDVDGCQSTNDSVFLLASGAGAAAGEDELLGPLTAVCAGLAEQMVRDAEGGTRLVRIAVDGASDEAAAETLARAVAHSVLWRAAVYGGDPNWGRVVAALGAADPKLEPERVTVALGDEVVFAAGEPCGSLTAAADALAAGEVVVACRVGDGPGRAEILTTDLSPEYVTLNAGGMS
ncbi:MAG TPA: bifunctional glutamate N-acetyltransferase/amino-acid acetyltransferase ArgJ [Actinomycetota bacterium]|nr:bifunctional glutamate N-acetyltransferase/amino-acid acetyltransferase ArgJ [Actinomycetota bacterium]